MTCLGHTKSASQLTISSSQTAGKLELSLIRKFSFLWEEIQETSARRGSTGQQRKGQK